MLIWQDNTATANGHPVGGVSGDGRQWTWHIEAVRGMHVTKSYGWCRTRSAAMTALERAWSKWCAAYGLTPA